MYADLHIHTKYSDSTLSIEDIIEKSLLLDKKIISICDHHTWAAYKEIDKLCKKNNIKYITGVEINASIKKDNSFVHLLAYNCDMDNIEMKKLLIKNKKIYDDYSYKFIKSLSKIYSKISLESYSKSSFTGKYGGWKAYEYLKTLNIVNSLEDYFDLLYVIDIDRPIFDTVESIVKRIHNANGKAVLAHPGNTFPEEKIFNYLKYVLNANIDGIECYYPKHTRKITNICVDFCNDNNLLITGGSDDHGKFVIDNHSDYTPNNFKVSIDSLRLDNLI